MYVYGSDSREDPLSVFYFPPVFMKYGGYRGKSVTWIQKITNYTYNTGSNLYFSLQLSNALKDLPNRVQTASKNERREIFQNVVNVLSNPGKSCKF